MVDVSEMTYAAKRCGVQAQLTHNGKAGNKFQLPKDLDAELQLERDFPYRVKPLFVFTYFRVYY